MNRRGLLALLGFAPIAGVSAALPRADNPNAMLKKVIEKADLLVPSANGLFRCEVDSNGQSIGITMRLPDGTTIKQGDYIGLTADRVGIDV